MKLSASFARSPLFVCLSACGLFLSIQQGLLSRIFHKDGASSDEHVLKPGEVKAGVLDLESSHQVEYTLEVAASTILVRVKLECSEADLDLSARSSDTDEEDPTDFRPTTEAGTSTIAISRFTEPPIAAGSYRFRVEWRSQNPPRSVDRKLEHIPFTIQAEVFETRLDGVLSPGVMTSGAIAPETGGYRTFKIDVPENARALRLDIAEAESDLDLFAERGHPVRMLSEEVYFAQHSYGRETLVIDSTSTPPLQGGTWYVDVLDQHDDERPTSFKVLATFDAQAPAALLEIPKLAKTPRMPEKSSDAEVLGREKRASTSVLARALVGVVEIFTDDGAGSGTVLTSDGWILTNAHVVTGLGEQILQEVVISVPLDPHRPCVEMFRGRVERVDKKRDLALVGVSSGFYGQPLPAGYAFPTVEMGDPETLAIGDPLWLVGYPSTGGQGSRVTITATRGVVSGFDTVAFGTVLKTDATITQGNSGGAALDAQGRIVGVPTSTIELGSGHIGYVHPLSLMPAEWQATVRARLPR